MRKVTFDTSKESNPTGLTAVELLMKARSFLMRDHPFIGIIACRFIFIESKIFPTTAVDAYGHLFYNKGWVESMTLEDAICEFAHEVGHIVQRTIGRYKKGLHHTIWNIASDQIIDTEYIVGSGIPPSTILQKMTTPDIQEKCKGNTLERRYFELVQDIKTDCPACQQSLNQLVAALQNEANGNAVGESDKVGSNEGETSGGSSGKEGGGSGTKLEKHTCGLKDGRGCISATLSAMENLGGSEDEKAAAQFQWEQAVLQAAHAAKEKGNVPGAVESWIATLKKPTVRWQDHIRTVATTVFKNRYTYVRKSRRAAALGMVLPGKSPDAKSAMAFIDTSGSVSLEAITSFVSEVAGILEACGCEKLYLGLHDVPVYHFGLHNKESLKQLKLSKGGTSHEDVFKVIEGKHPTFKVEGDPPGMVVCFTDLYSDQMNLKPPKMPVIWATLQEDAGLSIPFGKKVIVKQ